MRWFLFLAFSFRLSAGSFDDITPSSPEEILSLSTGLLIDGFVSVTSGQICISETDLAVKGAQDLVLKRTYIPPRILGRYDDKDKIDRLALGKELYQLETKGWVIHPHLWAGYNRNSKYFQVRDPQGFVLEFQIEGSKGILKTNSYGCSNLRGENATSSVDIRNIQFVVEGNWVKITWPDGCIRHYLRSYPGIYRLEKETLSNGKMIRYEYESGDLCKIVSSDPCGNVTYASIRKNGDHSYIGSDGNKANFMYERREVKGEDKKNGFKQKASFQFPVMTRAFNPIYINTVGYNERTLLNSYDGRSYPISCNYFEEKHELARIKTFSNPSGSFSFSYDPVVIGKKGGATTVTHPDGTQTIYRFNKLFLLEAIENWFENKLINKKMFAYDFKQHIASIKTLDSYDNLLIAKYFECDHAGNAVRETIEGDLGLFTIKRKFDNNRIVFEEYDNGLKHTFTYLKDTRLVTSKTTFEFDVKLRRTLYIYDDANNLIQMEEEGKTRTTYTLRETNPHLHRVACEEARDWEGLLIYKIHYGYDQWGNRDQEEYFGSDDTLAYTIQRTYNEKGELLAETNPLGERAVYEYDARGRCFHEKPFSNGLVIDRTFDDKGRLTLLQEDDHKTQFEYNASDRLIKKIDYLGVTTRYRYHPVHKNPDRIEERSAVTEIRYDLFGRPILTIDSTNAKTKREFNSYGDIVKIIYPEEGEEFFTYYPNSLLKSHTNADGLITAYSYDALNRIKEKTVGKLTTTYEYDGYNLCSITDPAGFITTYKYDLIDRKIEETREGRITRYQYDSLGFLSKEEKGKHTIAYTNDATGRVLIKSIDGVLPTFWSYDGGGNVTAIEHGEISRFSYDSHNRCLEKIDEEGNKTTVFYQKGPEVLIKKITDPIGIETVYTYNSRNQLLTKAVNSQIVEEFEYDPLSRLQKQDHISFGYTPNGNRQWMKESNIRSTNWTYTPGNLTLTKQKADGTSLRYQYDEELFLKEIGTRKFQYDDLGRLIGGTGFSRTLDPFGNILREEWSNGLWITTNYDELNRPILRTLPDHSQIKYQYDGPLLKKVSRLSSDGNELYSHSYKDYDARGNVRIEKGLFETTYEYDRKGRRIRQKNPYVTEELTYNRSGHLVQKGDITYTYDSLSQMTSESGNFTAYYDTHYNPTKINNKTIEIDLTNQIEGFNYDLNGNLINPGFIYDEFDQLIEAAGEKFIYDALGRRIQKGATSFLYIGDQEIGAFENGEPKELKILGANTPIAIEINRTPYAPIIDVQGVIRSLVDWQTKKVVKQNECNVFAEGLSAAIPYAYLGKRYDQNTGLLYFGKRYYDPTLRRWLTPDPIGPSNHANLYQYLFNNPYLYQDDNGEFAFAIPLLFWGAELAVPTISACITAITYSAVAGAVAYSGYKFIETFNNFEYPALKSYCTRDLVPTLNKWSYSIMKNGSVDPTLPSNPDDLLKRPGWEETTHPSAGKKGHRTFENGKTGEKLRHDKGKPGESGHEKYDHYHRPNPNKTNKHDEYLDHNYNPVGRHSDSSHLYPPNNIWWNR
ncbi:MAG: RHS repeat-associated core domain-containing protein [Verrucomicrobia bacterium]|nr:RHS repeat-associated core domain-containing protein [Verrucomicrobiota bacterium]